MSERGTSERGQWNAGENFIEEIEKDVRPVEQGVHFRRALDGSCGPNQCGRSAEEPQTSCGIAVQCSAVEMHCRAVKMQCSEKAVQRTFSAFDAFSARTANCGLQSAVRRQQSAVCRCTRAALRALSRRKFAGLQEAHEKRTTSCLFFAKLDLWASIKSPHRATQRRSCPQTGSCGPPVQPEAPPPVGVLLLVRLLLIRLILVLVLFLILILLLVSLDVSRPADWPARKPQNTHSPAPDALPSLSLSISLHLSLGLHLRPARSPSHRHRRPSQFITLKRRAPTVRLALTLPQNWRPTTGRNWAVRRLPGARKRGPKCERAFQPSADAARPAAKSQPPANSGRRARSPGRPAYSVPIAARFSLCLASRSALLLCSALATTAPA